MKVVKAMQSHMYRMPDLLPTPVQASSPKPLEAVSVPLTIAAIVAAFIYSTSAGR